MILRNITLTVMFTVLATSQHIAEAAPGADDPAANDNVYTAGNPALQHWQLPAAPPHPENNPPTEARVELGKKLFFDTRLSGDGNMSCASCHNPMYGWSDGLGTAKGKNSQVLDRASPTIVNTAYNTIQMWDGRKKSLEDQALGPMMSGVEMATDIPKLIEFLQSDATYRDDFANAFPDVGVNEETIAQAIASFERTVVSRNSPFDRWLAGDPEAMTQRQVEGFMLFDSPDKGNCSACHSAPNFTDDGFHNIGLASFGAEDPDLGRYNERKIRLLKGAFKTPTLRDISLTAPYFHDGSADTLEAVMDHYIIGGEVKSNLSPSMKALALSEDEKAAIVDFLTALTTPPEKFELPSLPPRNFLAKTREH